MKDPIEDIPDPIDDGPEDSIYIEDEPPDAYDAEAGYPTAVEDIAIVAWEALRALRLTQGVGCGPSWMHTPKPDQSRMVKVCQAVIADPEKPIDHTEHRLVAGIVKALAP
jgi:hypothetical protein